jgi:NAD(P)-dependent dehydrogenase (short-subunit alcohol dehydrogenase family)
MSGARVALVTGANRGIGLEVCRQLAERGLVVVLTARDGERGEEAAASLAGAGAVHSCTLDVRSDASVHEAFSFIERRFGALDVLVNNAAIYPDPGRRVLEVDPEQYGETFDVNTLGPLRLCQAFVPGMLARDYGRVVNVSSEIGRGAALREDTPSYRVSKAALNALTRMVAHAARGRNVLVNAADPGWVRTDMGGRKAPRNVEKGAETIVWLATMEDGGPSGRLFRDRAPIEW